MNIDECDPENPLNYHYCDYTIDEYNDFPEYGLEGNRMTSADDEELRKLLGLSKKAYRYYKYVEIRSHGTIVPLTEYANPYEKCEYGCLICSHQFIATPQRLSLVKYSCPICRYRERLYSKGFELMDLGNDALDFDEGHTWKAMCTSCGMVIPAFTVGKWTECRNCKIVAIYGDEYIIRDEDISTPSADSIEILHRSCRKKFYRSMGYFLAGKAKCPYCAEWYTDAE